MASTIQLPKCTNIYHYKPSSAVVVGAREGEWGGDNRNDIDISMNIWLESVIRVKFRPANPRKHISNLFHDNKTANKKDTLLPMHDSCIFICRRIGGSIKGSPSDGLYPPHRRGTLNGRSMIRLIRMNWRLTGRGWDTHIYFGWRPLSHERSS